MTADESGAGLPALDQHIERVLMLIFRQELIEYDGRPVEVQLRTQVMHEWAVTVERVWGRLGEDLKSGVGPAPVLSLMEEISEVMAIEEGGGVVGQEALDRLGTLREEAKPFLEGGGHRISPGSDRHLQPD